jgi:hypothetical protein
MHLRDCQILAAPEERTRLTCMADTSIVDLDSYFMGFWGRDLNVFNDQVFSCFPGHCGLSMVSTRGLTLSVRGIS